MLKNWKNSSSNTLHNLLKPEKFYELIFKQKCPFDDSLKLSYNSVVGSFNPIDNLTDVILRLLNKIDAKLKLKKLQ